MRFTSTEMNCRSCQRLYPASDLDRYLWCPNCRSAARRRAGLWGRVVGIVAALAVTGYILLAINRSRLDILWALPPLMTYVLVSRIVVAVVQGYYRARGGGESATSEEG